MKRPILYVCIVLMAAGILYVIARPDSRLLNAQLSVKQTMTESLSQEGQARIDPSLTPADFAGEWDWLESPDGQSFYLRLEQQGTELKGSYCATAFWGSRVDCGFDEGACFVSGVVRGNTADVEFLSCYGGEKGQASLVRLGDRIEWSIREVPSGRWYFCPRKAVLEKAIKIHLDTL